MVNTKFELYKIKREIKRSGATVEFLRPGQNEYGEKDESSLVSLYVSKGLYHELNSHISVTTGETTQYRSKKIPAIMLPFSEINPIGLRTGDIAKINNKEFRITKVENIQEWNIICDINLEVEDVGL